MTKDLFAGRIVDGKLVLEKESRLSCWDWGVLYGYGLFETMRVYSDGRIFALQRHLARLFSSCSHLEIDPGLTPEALADAAREYVVQTGLAQGALRLTVTRGDAHRGIRPAVFFFSRQVTYSPLDYERGYTAVFSPLRRNQTSPLVYHKTLNYMENLLALEEARRAGAREVLFLNTNLHLTEGAVSNLFFVQGRILHTPAVTCGLLAGIARQTVIDLASARGYPVMLGEYVLENLLAADEAFLTNSLMEVMPLVKVNETLINHGKPGPVARELLGHYRTLTGENPESS
ncbi:MAG: aminotransferase class IV [Bacillota bacterium]